MNELPETNVGTTRVRMWRHYCPAEHGLISVGEGERCNWCTQQEAKTPDPSRPAFLAVQAAEAV